MDVLHNKKDIRQFSQGADYDSSEKFIGASDAGLYIDAKNMRHTDDDQDSLTKIGGELSTYPAINNACFLSSPYAALASTYQCIGSLNFFLEDDKKTHIIEFWAASNFNYALNRNPPFIRIDGVVVAMSRDFPITYDHPLQIDKNENCVGGEVYITDYNVPPMIFNVADLMVNSRLLADENGNLICTQIYFSEFDIDKYVVELIGDNNHPIFVQITTQTPTGAEQIGTGGLDAGMYQYQFRKVSNQGDATGWSKATPLIPVIARYSSQGSNPYSDPYNKTYGGDVGISFAFGIHIRIRIDNKQGFDYVQIKRTRYTDGQAVGSPGIEKLLDYRLDIADNDLFVKDIFDIGAAELDLDDTSNVSQFASILRAKTNRYYNARLVYSNVEFQKRNIPLTFGASASGKTLFPVVDKLTTPTRQDGHKNPWNAAYRETYTRGERYGFAVVGRDANNQPSFAIPPPNVGGDDYQNFQMPNRRDVATADTRAWSTGMVKAATVDGLNGTQAVDQTYEVFDTVDSITKNDSHQKFFTVLNTAGTPINYYPFTPAGLNNPADHQDISGLAYIINPNVYAGDENSGVTTPYNPKGFGLNYFALGMAIYNITGIPSYIKSFSVVRTPPANRVVAQGLGYYTLLNPSTFDNGKSQTTFTFYSPDLDANSGIAPNLIDEIRTSVGAGSSRYKVQLVSPLGFFTEVYSGHRNNAGAVIDDVRWSRVDMVNYVRLLREDGSINVGDSPSGVPNSGAGVGFSSSPIDGFGYTGYSKWRRTTNPAGGNAFPNGGSGNQLFDIATVNVYQGASTMNLLAQQIEITTTQPFYEFPTIVGGTGNRSFPHPDTQNWHEPMYIVNIIDTLASVPQGNIQNYIETEQYQKTEALIGISASLARQEFILVDERIEDVTNVIFVDNKAWMNVTGFTVPVLAPIIANIIAGTQNVVFNGVAVQIFGVFQVATSPITNIYNQYSIVFDPALNTFGAPASIFVPGLTAEIVVVYDTSFPVKFFGGETTIHETVFSPMCLRFPRTDGTVADNSDGQNFHFSYPYPYLGYQLASNYLRPRDCNVIATDGRAFESSDNVQFLSNAGTRGMTNLRQILAMFTCESRISLPFSFEAPSDGTQHLEKYYPATHYIARPSNWSSGTANSQTNAFSPDYDTMYPNEVPLWEFGGFRFQRLTNLDYSATQVTQGAVSAPRVGFEEDTLFCTINMWSLRRATNIQDAPGLRTFPATNFLIISDDTGDIKYLYDDQIDSKGSNLYAITESGICLLITDKSLLYTSTGDQLAATGITGGSTFIQGELWLSKTIGMTDEMWRTAAEGYHVISGNNSERRMEALFFSNNMSQYRLSGGAIDDIARGAKYHSRIFPFLKSIRSGYQDKVSAIYDTFNDEYWVTLQPLSTLPPIPRQSFVYAEKKSRYRGTFDYLFDKYTSFDGNTYGMRNAITYLLDHYGSQINGADVESKLVGVSAKQPNESKNFSRIRISPAGPKPTLVQFYESKADYLANANRAEIDTTVLPFALKLYGSWEGYIPRKVAAPRDHLQGEQCIFVIKSIGNDRFKITLTEIGYKGLK